MCLSPRFQPVPAHLLHVGRTITTVWGMKILMIERESRGEWVSARRCCYYSGTTMGTVLSLQNLCPTFCLSPCDQTIIVGDCLPRPSETKRFIKEEQCLKRAYWFSYKYLELKVRLCPTGGLHIRGQSVTHKDSSGKQRQGHAPADRCWRFHPAAH